jgi:SAM-dependent methyltransferase
VESRFDHEEVHGRKLAHVDTERIWGWSSPAGRLRARRRADLIIAGAALGEGVRALELGCGTGLFTSLFADSGAHITAVDISPDLLSKARQRKLDPARVTFVEGAFEDAALEGPFDAVVGSSILHHLSVPAALARIRDLLKPSGLMSFAEPNLLNPQVCMERLGARVPGLRRLFWYVSPDELAFVRSALRRNLERSGFVDVQVTNFDWLHPATPPPAIPFVRSLGGVLERIPLVREFSGSLWIRARRS